ncbi:helix-turn-helix domain-containing protein [Kitasatospora sp. NPDC056138]|uniref:helix-turn-helix domain-containing protein n=1 Tax=Kitasatospora sp. NPDC056138 TaxID=3345724 RepID=UPI0035DDE3EA
MANRRTKQKSKEVGGRQQPDTASTIAPVSPALDAMPEDRQAKAVRQLVGPGQRRRTLVTQLEQVERELRPVVLEAVAAGVTYRRIAELSGISRATVARWAKTE